MTHTHYTGPAADSCETPKILTKILCKCLRRFPVDQSLKVILTKASYVFRIRLEQVFLSLSFSVCSRLHIRKLKGALHER